MWLGSLALAVTRLNRYNLDECVHLNKLIYVTMYIKRVVQKHIEANLYQGKVIVVYGPRQSGKTTMVKNIIEGIKSSKYLLCELPEVSEILQTQSPEKILSFFGDVNLVVLDEAQTVKNIGRILKVLVDTHPEVQIIATGSSSFELSNVIVEPLTGRKLEFMLLPLSVEEMLGFKDRFEVSGEIEQYLRYGLYPGIYVSKQEKSAILMQEITTSYLFKDILAFRDIRNSEMLVKLVQLLALQIGSEVSYTEISNSLGIDQITVQKYIDLLEKLFIIHRLTPFSRNLRKELNKKRKIYFYDLGMRNALLRNFNLLDIRQDVGALWENFCINERLKLISNNQIFANRYFWRTWDGAEIDYVEDRDGMLRGYEFKWTKGSKQIKAPKVWKEAYKNSEFYVVNRDNVLDFVTKI